jgi:prolyl 4-hydroxylase
MSKGGQRMVTCLLYLNDVEKGGGTSFPRLDMEVRAKKGQEAAIS